MENNNIPQQSNEDILQKNRKNFFQKICSEKDFQFLLNEKQKKSYSKYKSCCCREIGILVCSFFIFIAICANIYYALSRNEGYNAYKLVLEQNITRIPLKFPNDEESLKLIDVVNNVDNLDLDDPNKTCNYAEFQALWCSYEQYKNYCTLEKYKKGLCSYMDYEIYNGNANLSFCTFEQYRDNNCTEQQYLDYEEKYSSKIIEGIPSSLVYERDKENPYIIYVYYLRGFSFQKLWCEIGKYDMGILISSLFFIILFIIFLLFNIISNKNKIKNGIRYYITLIIYISFYVILKIYILLYAFLFTYSYYIILYFPKTYVHLNSSDYEEDAFYFSFYKITEKDDKVTILWKENGLNAIIFTFINLLLFILFWICSSLYKIIYTFLSYDFENNNNDKNINEIKKKASVKVGKNYYNIEIFPNQNIYLNENETNIIYNFTKIVYNDNYYYLKTINKGLRDQLGWIDYKYPLINEGFSLIIILFKIIIAIIFYAIYSKYFQINDEFIYKYERHLFELGYHPKLYRLYDKFGNLSEKATNLMIIIYILIEILFIIFIFKRILFGGTSNIIISISRFIISIIFCLINLIFMIFSIYFIIYSIILLCFFIIYGKLIFIENNGIIAYKFFAFISVYFYFFILFLIIFIFSKKLSKYFYNIKIENDKLGFFKSRFEEVFRYKSLNQENKMLEVDNSENCPNNLFYKQKNDENPIPNINKNPASNISNTIFGLELYYEECLNDNEKNKYFFYKKAKLFGKGLIGNLYYLIIIGTLIFIFTIISLATLIKNNENYISFRTYLQNTFYYYSSSYTIFWCDLGDVENDVLISFFIFLIIYLAFEILSLLIHKKILNLFDLKKGLFYYAVILINIIFYIIFMIYIPLLLYLFIYSVLVTFLSPLLLQSKLDDNNNSSNNDNELEELWNEDKNGPIINCIIKFILFLLSNELTNIKYSIIHYLNMDYIEENNNNDYKDINDNNDKEIKNTVMIKNNEYNVKIKINENIYIKQIDTNNIYRFKKILIKNITNDYVYVKLGLNSITDQISKSEWDYPMLNKTFILLASLSKKIYAILFLSIPLFKLQIFDEYNYKTKISVIVPNYNKNNKIKEPLFLGIFSYYGFYEESKTKTRFILYTIYLFVILLFMLYRIYFGGFKKPIYNFIAFIISIYFIIQNSIYVICIFLLLLFNIFSIISYYDGFRDLEDYMIQSKLIIQFVLNIPIFIIYIYLLINSIKLCSHLNSLRKELLNFMSGITNEEDEQKNELEFKYISLNKDICVLKEYRHEKLQRYLYYTKISEALVNSEPQDKQIENIDNIEKTEKKIIVFL